jgi:selenocysteine-specific translation elongation factor
MAEIEIGTVSDFFARPMVAGIALSAPLKIGDTIHIKGHTTDIMMTVQSMQIDNANVSEARTGDAVGIKLTDRARKGDTVFVVTA